MIKNIKRITAVLLLVALVIAIIPATAFIANAATISQVGSLWDGFTSGSGTFTVTDESRLFVVTSSAPTGDLLQTAQLIQRELRAEFSGSFGELVWGPESYAKTGDIVLKLDTSSGTGADGYKLNVTGSTATVTAADTDGLIYGANSLMKCFRAVGGNSISGFSGNDSPDTKERTVSLDCGRKYLTAEWIKNFIRQMSWMGYNTLQLHFSDDGGYRADFWDPSYYTSNFSPDNDFTWLCGSKVQYWVYNGNKSNSSYPYATDPDAGKYLTTKELVEICEVAKEYHIDVIPSFDSPAHMDYITWRFEQYYNSNTSYSFTYNGKTWKASSTKGCINYTGTTGRPAAGNGPNWYYAAVDITAGTMAEAFVLALYEDMADFFKEYAGSTDFSIGADEVGQGSSVKWTYAEDFPVYINKLNGILNDKGYTMRMYNDFIGTTAYSTTQSFDSNIEIMYWDSPFDPNSGGSGTKTQPASYFVNKGITIYNCIQTHTYHVLRIANTSNAATKYTDARNPANRQWTFYHSTEKLIYNEWVPNNVSEKGDYSESVADIPNANLGGAYFLIWNDYASVSTEAQLWNGAPDTTGTNNGVTYYLLDRMASNIIKMWNWDINNTVAYSKFAEVRDTFGNFPGFTSCSKAASLPAATNPVKATTVDKSALQAAVDAAPTTQDNYTNSTWANYQTALTAARAILNNDEATQDEVNAALATLNTATSSLVAVDKSALRAAVNGAITEQGNYTDSTWNAYQTALSAAQGVLSNGDATQAQVNTALANLNDAKDKLISVDKSALRAAVNNAPTSQGIYTDESWNAYQTALSTAQGVLDDGNATQQAVDTALSDLNNAIKALEKKPIEGGYILSIHKASDITPVGKKIGLIITASADAVDLTISLGNNTVTPAVCLNNIQTLRIDGVETQVSVWMLHLTANEAGSFTYTVTVNGTSTQDVEITVE